MCSGHLPLVEVEEAAASPLFCCSSTYVVEALAPTLLCIRCYRIFCKRAKNLTMGSYCNSSSVGLNCTAAPNMTTRQRQASPLYRKSCQTMIGHGWTFVSEPSASAGGQTPETSTRVWWMHDGLGPKLLRSIARVVVIRARLLWMINPCDFRHTQPDKDNF